MLYTVLSYVSQKNISQKPFHVIMVVLLSWPIVERLVPQIEGLVIAMILQLALSNLYFPSSSCNCARSSSYKTSFTP